ncbi:thioredoxin domain-containing protein [Aquimarina brevivitae]|nr:thioredoxin domain-containing protein [Aquimarina brevivitae]
MSSSANQLINETSPYLLQHAYNPVDWRPWNPETLQIAKENNKLIIISIGYAACHWCHVMEHESFEDSDVATLMNKFYVPIKIDREERPDIDQVYMSAVQLMTGQGGWPLNIVALPDGRPIWGGTYFPKENWMQALEKIALLFQQQPKKLEEYADKLQQGMFTLTTIEGTSSNDYTAILSESISKWKTYLDNELGGINRVPKFMMPCNYKFLLHYAHLKKDNNLLDHVLLTLDKMAYGGIYDQIGGGFSRYSTDEKWHIPHFEKMLYDNAQIVSLYSEAFKLTQKPLYKEIVYQTLDFIAEELTAPEGIFYSALDADSKDATGKSKEGAFYVWTKAELIELCSDSFSLFSTYYNINSYGYWEEENYVLIRTQSDEDFCKKQGITQQHLAELKQHWNTTLKKERAKRNKPPLDDKCLTGWNGLMISAYIDAFTAFKEDKFKDKAICCANFLAKHLIEENGSLYRNYKNGKATINGYLEDYATLIQAFIKMYNITLDPKWYRLAKKLSSYTITHFYNTEKRLFHFTSDLDPKLVVRSIEYEDNVIPSSNSIMATNLFLLAKFENNLDFKNISNKALQTILTKIEDYPMGYANWLQLLLHNSAKFYELIVVGDSANEQIKKLHQRYLPHTLITGSTDKDAELILFSQKYKSGKTLIYLCTDQACLKTTENIFDIDWKNI